MEFAHIDPSIYLKYELTMLELPESYATEGYALRVFRRRNLRDIKDFSAKAFDFTNVQDFVMKSTFVGPGPDIVRELTNENALKIFTYNKPILILFRDVTKTDFKYYDKQLIEAFESIQHKILVCLAATNLNIG